MKLLTGALVAVLVLGGCGSQVTDSVDEGSQSAADAVPGAWDIDFANSYAGSGTGLSPTGEDGVDVVATQPDGKLVVGGDFDSYNGNTKVNLLARFTQDGSLDTAFTNAYAGTGVGLDAKGAVEGVAVQPDGKIVVVGYFTNYNGKKAPGIARFNSDGSLDADFSNNDPTKGGITGVASTVALQRDGKIVIGGQFTVGPEGKSVENVARFNADGSLDSDFIKTYGNGGKGLVGNFGVLSVAVQSDGKILVGGDYQKYNGDAKANKLTRFNPDGSLDAAFTKTYAGTGNGLNGFVMGMKVQPDGKIVLTGNFTGYNANAKVNGLARFNSDGSLDTAFANTYAGPGTGLDFGADNLAVQGDGGIVVVGAFSKYNGNPRVNHLARFNSDGSLDATFAKNYAGAGTGLDFTVHAIDVAGSEILVGGIFTKYNGDTKANLLTRFEGAEGGTP
ncbi:MAG: delta-60 repeat domain-containing protein [Actinobacteria bacterium]|nr:delta-60 repeat domain-containing protein [Actinomycetota bacterium]